MVLLFKVKKVFIILYFRSKTANVHVSNFKIHVKVRYEGRKNFLLYALLLFDYDYMMHLLYFVDHVSTKKNSFTFRFF